MISLPNTAGPEEKATQICHKLLPPTPPGFQGCVQNLCYSTSASLFLSGPGPTLLHPERRDGAREDPHCFHLHEPAQAAWLQGASTLQISLLLACLSWGLFEIHSFSLFPGQSCVEKETDPSHWVRRRLWTQLKEAIWRFLEAGYKHQEKLTNTWNNMYVAKAPPWVKIQHFEFIPLRQILATIFEQGTISKKPVLFIVKWVKIWRPSTFRIMYVLCTINTLVKTSQTRICGKVRWMGLQVGQEGQGSMSGRLVR